MLKGRGKTFAPKKVPLRKPGPAPASAPKSVEPQLQTPESTQQEEVPAEKNDPPFVSQVQSGGIDTQSDSQASSSIDVPANPIHAPPLKRKEREEDAPAPIAKRHASDAQAVFQASVAPMTEKEPSEPPTTSTTAPTIDISSPNNLKRKERAPLPSAQPSQSIPEAQSLNTPPSSIILLAVQAEEPANPSASSTTEISQTTPSQDPSPRNTNPVESGAPAVSLPDNGVQEPIAASSQSAGPAAPVNPEDTAGSAREEPAAGNVKPKRKPRAKKAAVAPVSQEIITDDEDGSDAGPSVPKRAPRVRRPAAPRKSRKKPDGGEKEKRKRVRAPTPSDASDQEIDPEVITMGDLTKDMKIGKRLSNYAEIRELAEKRKQDAAKARLRRTNPEMAALLEPEGGTTSGDPNAASSSTTAQSTGGAATTTERVPSPEPAQVQAGPRLRLLNGRMILDESSLQIDRHANAQLQRDGMETVEENDFTRLVNSGTFLKREPSQAWDTAANQLFYKGLRQFGTDFEMIASMFPHRNRRQIKLKFNKEEKVNAAKINRILINPKDPIDLEEWEKMADKKLEPLEVIQAEREKYDAEQREEIAKFTNATAEAQRKKKESIKGSDAARRLLEGMSDESDAETGIGGSNKENGGKGKKRGRARMDDPGEIVGTID